MPTSISPGVNHIDRLTGRISDVAGVPYRRCGYGVGGVRYLLSHTSLQIGIGEPSRSAIAVSPSVIHKNGLVLGDSMSYSVRHQVFVSSTFTDLVEERSEVIQAIWELDCIPTGMEAFVATNQSQWDVIQKVIDESDYYVLIIGGRYGSLTDEGISYTEKEFRYARKQGVPVLAFVHSEPESIAVGKTDKNADARDKLEAFRKTVMDIYPVRSWKTAVELGSIVSRSLSRETKISPRPGWIRNDGSSPIALLEQISKLTDENRELREQVSAFDSGSTDETLEAGSDKVILHGTRLEKPKHEYNWTRKKWACEATWDDLFKDIGPSLINETTERDLRETISRFSGWDPVPAGVSDKEDELSLESWNEILIQFRALGLIAPGVKKRGVNDKNSYWAITPRGDRHLVSLLARRKV